MSVTEASLPVVFFVTRTARDKWADAASLGNPDEFPQRIRSGVDVWIVSTFLELRARASAHGFRVAFTAQFAPAMPVIAHRDDLHLRLGYWRSYVAAVRADRPYVHLAPWQVVQTPVQANDAGGAVHIPSWPQPGLVPRAAGRKGLRTLGYFGRESSLPGFFRDPAFVDELARRDIVFQYDPAHWHDYASVDVAIGLRYEPEIGLSTKPYAKLVNAWHARVPAVLGAEPAYRALRRSDLDYLEVRSARDVLDALDRLKRDPALYAAMVDNGAQRAREYTRDAVAERWCRFVSRQFLPAWREWRAERHGRVGLLARAGARLLRQWKETRRYKRIEASQLAALRAAAAGERLEP